MSDAREPAPTEWMPRQRWDALVRGDGCPLCDEVQLAAPANPFSFFVARLGMSQVRLARNQHLPGLCTLICTRHVREPFELEQAERAAFFEDVARVGKALETAFGAAKINYQILGNAIPHLHCHITPRRYGDSYPGRPPDLDRHETVSDSVYRQRVELIRAALRSPSLHVAEAPIAHQ